MIPLDAIRNDRNVFEKAAAQITPEILGSVIDHTLLNPVATKKDVLKLLQEANEIGSFVCINGSRIVDTKQFIEALPSPTNIRGIASVIGFPFGAETTGEKVGGAYAALVEARADEVDMVLNVGKLLDGKLNFVIQDIHAVAQAVKNSQYIATGEKQKKILKVIQENCCLTDVQKESATHAIVQVAREANIHMFAKTSTGFGTPKDEKTPRGATLGDVWRMNQIVSEYRKNEALIGVKAAGGIGDAETAIKMMLAGGCFDDNIKLVENPSDVFRIGASAGKKIVEDFNKHYFCLRL